MAKQQDQYIQYIFKDGQYRLVAGGGAGGEGQEILVVDKLPEQAPEGTVFYLVEDQGGGGGSSAETENRNIPTRFKAKQLAYDKFGNQKTLSQIVFTNTTGKTLYIVGDVRRHLGSITGNKNTRRFLSNKKGVHSIPWNLKSRQKVYSQNIQEVAPGEQVPLWKLLNLPFNELQSTYSSDLATNSFVYAPGGYPYTIYLVDSKLRVKPSVGSIAYSVNHARESGKHNLFDYLFFTKNRKKCIYIIDRGSHQSGNNITYYTKNVYLALNIEYYIDTEHSDRLCLKFNDINTF